MKGDQAHYAFRSVGYMDYLSSIDQTTPLQWFEQIPWWSKLSFHDHPPLVFSLQYLSMKIFGVSGFAARLPSALAGLLTILFVYLIGKNLYSRKIGLLSALTLTVSNYLIWISRTALLEAVMIFFVVLSIYFFIKAWSETKYLIYWGVALGLAFLSKYIAFFLIPVYLIFILFKKRHWLREKNLWLGLILIVLIFSPVIVYNGMMFSARGHFDMQFASLFGQSNEDWTLIERAPGFSFQRLTGDSLNVLKSVYSPFSLLLFIFALPFFIWRRGNQHKFFILASVAFALLGVAILGPTNRYLSIISVYLALITGFSLALLLELLSGKKIRKALVFLLFLILSVDLLYTVNNNILPVSLSEKLELSSRASWIGYSRLDRYFQDGFRDQCSDFSLAKGSIEAGIIENFNRKNCQINNQTVVVYDDKIDWFEAIWIFDKLRFYQSLPIIHAGMLDLIMDKGGDEAIEVLNSFSEFYIVSLENLSLVDKYSSGSFDLFKNQILSQRPDVKPDIIKGFDNSISFKIYKFDNLRFR